MAEAIVLQLTGRRSDKPEVPSLLRSTTTNRSVDGDRTPDPFLPPGLLEARAAIDLAGGVRGLPEGTSAELEADAGQVLVIELADGGTLITSPAGLKAALLRNRPDLVDAAGRILFDRVNAEGAVPERGVFAGAAGSLVSQVVALAVGRDPLIDAAQARLAELMPGEANDKLAGLGDIGVSWLGTKALMWAIEERLSRPAGHLYRWEDSSGTLEGGVADDTARMVGADGKPRPALVFIHGTGSSTLGSFGDLQRSDRGLWARLESRFPGGISGFEHRTLSESPIENALQLAAALPRGARVSLVTHSRGGLVGDLLCLQDIDRHIDSYSFAFPGVGDAQGRETAVRKELDRAHAEHRDQLRALFALLRDKSLVVERYVRVASPAQGTRLASGNFDV